MTASVSAAARPKPGPAGSSDPGGVESGTTDFDLVESSAGWELTITLTDRLREALARSDGADELRFAVRVAPNLVPGEPFVARLTIKDQS